MPPQPTIFPQPDPQSSTSSSRCSRPVVFLVALAVMPAILLVAAILFAVMSARSSPAQQNVQGAFPSSGASRSTTTPQGPVQSGVNPKWEILFLARPDGKTDHVYLMNADGSNVRQLTNDTFRDATAEWSFDGTKIVFERDGSTGPAIYLMNAYGSEEKRLSPSPGRDVLPAFTPDGRIIFSRVVTPSSKDGEMPKTAIMIMNQDGTGTKTLLSRGTFDIEPRVSPDGKMIIFMCGPRDAGMQICAMDIDGANVRQLTHATGANNGDPHWSTDGSKISFGSDREGGGLLNFYTMNRDGSDVEKVTNFPRGQEAGDTGWSPDNQLIAFEWDVDGKKQSDPKAKAEIWVVGADGSKPHTTGVACSAVGCAPRFRPTGR